MTSEPIQSDPDDPLDPDELRRSWRIITYAGFLGSVYYILCITGAPRIKFLTDLNATATDFGVIAGLASFAIVFQIVGSLLGSRIKQRKALWIGLALTHRLVYFGVLVAPFLFAHERWRIVWIILVLLIHDSLAQTSVPIWLGWMSDLLPKDTFTRHWAVRQRFITAANIGVMVILAFTFNYFEANDRVIQGFVLLASVGIVMGVIDILMFIAIPDPVTALPERLRLKRVLTQPLRDASFRPFLLFMGLFHFGVFTAAPFFGLYMLEHLEMKVLSVQLLGVAAATGIVLSSRFWGLLCDTYGYRPMLQLLAVGKVTTPIAYILAPSVPAIAIPWLAIAMFFDGILNGGFQLAIQGILLKSTPRPNRTMYIAAANFLSVGIMATIAPVVAGRFIDFIGVRFSWSIGIYVFTGYQIAFAMSALLRLLAVGSTVWIQEPGSVPLRQVLPQIRRFSAIKVMRLVYRLNESADVAARLDAARRLGVLGHPMAIGELARALHDPDETVQSAAAESLSNIGVAEACEPLAQALFNPKTRKKSPVARALGILGGDQSLKALLYHLRHQDPESLDATITSLEKIGDDVAVLPLICLYHETEDPELRRHIAQALRTLTATETVEEVFHLLHERRPPDHIPLK